MNKKELLEFMKADYANAEEENSDAFKNLNMCEVFDVCSSETGIFVRLTDKFSRLSTFLARGTLKVKDESIDDTLDDIIVYATLMKARMAERRARELAR